MERLFKRMKLSEDINPEPLRPLPQSQGRKRRIQQSSCVEDNIKKHRVGPFTGLALSCALGKLKDVDRLLKEGYDVNEKTPNGITPLIIAVICGDVRIVIRLLESEKIDVHVRDKKDRDCFAFACFWASEYKNAKRVHICRILGKYLNKK